MAALDEKVAQGPHRETLDKTPSALQVHAERTPNPATLKFVCDTSVSPAGPLAFSTAQEAVSSPFARHIFQVVGVAGVFLGHDFVSVTKKEGSSWENLESAVIKAVREACILEKPIWDESAVVGEDSSEEGAGFSAEGMKAEPGTVERDIQDLLDQRVRPFVARDGGDIVFHRFEEGVVYLTLRGACSGCPSASVTLKNGVENMLRHFIPEVQSVQAVA